jgi:hypothetical protein
MAENTASREAALDAARGALADLKAADWQADPAYWLGRLETALTQIVGEADSPAPTPAPVDISEVAEAARHGETVRLHRALCDTEDAD